MNPLSAATAAYEASVLDEREAVKETVDLMVADTRRNLADDEEQTYTVLAFALAHTPVRNNSVVAAEAIVRLAQLQNELSRLSGTEVKS